MRRLFEVNSEPHTGARPSVRLCVGPELARCVHIKGKDKPWGIGKAWSLEEAQHQCPKDRYISCCYYLKDKPYAVVDIDDPNYTMNQLFEDTGIDSCYLKGNTKGFHVWIQFEQGKPDLFKKNFVNIGLPTTIDFLGAKSI